MSFYTLDPLHDSRWDDLVASHPRASVFHARGWLKALARTYGYRPFVLTSTPDEGPLSSGIAFCAVTSWLTGARLVSLPFADHAEPLLGGADDESEAEDWIRELGSQGRWKYVELRPIAWGRRADSPLVIGPSFWLHTLDLRPPLQELAHNMHKDCIRRRIQHAQQMSLEYERGSSDALLQAFYRLLVITRKRHRLLPQPYSWFQNLIKEFCPRPEIRVARKDGVAVAAIFTLRHRGSVVYKYGCSDERLHRLAGMPFLFWKLIEESKAEGAVQIDLGRTEPENRGLIEFKDRLGASKCPISYLRHPRFEETVNLDSPRVAAVRRVFSTLPSGISSGLGKLVYRHMA
jgi:hypothetical protein